MAPASLVPGQRPSTLSTDITRRQTLLVARPEPHPGAVVVGLELGATLREIVRNEGGGEVVIHDRGASSATPIPWHPVAIRTRRGTNGSHQGDHMGLGGYGPSSFSIDVPIPTDKRGLVGRRSFGALHQFGGLNGKVVDAGEARTVVATAA